MMKRLYSKVINQIILIVLPFALCCCSPSGTVQKLSDAPDDLGKTHKAPEYLSYSIALEKWKSINEVADWMRQYFSYDFSRALDLSETNRGDTKKVAVYSPSELYSKKKGVCVDLARFGVETVRKIFPESHPRYVMIEFTPIIISGKTIRKHWIASYQKEGKYYYFADSKRPGYISGPFNYTEEFINQYERYRGREIVSFKELDDFKKKRRLKKRKIYQRQDMELLNKMVAPDRGGRGV